MIRGSSSLGFKEMLTELFDKEFGDTYIRETKTAGSVFIESPCISFIGASTFEWLQTHLKDSDLRSGFLARFCYVIKKNYPKESIANPDFIEIDDEYVDLLRHLNNIPLHYLDLSEEAKTFYKDWYEKNKPKVLKEDTFLHSVMGRIFEVFHKIAIINHAVSSYGENCLGTSTVGLNSYEQVLPWVEFFIANVKNHYQELTQKANTKEIKIIEIIKKRGTAYGNKKRISRSELFKYANLRKNEGEQIIKTLVVKQLLSIVNKGSHTYYEVLGE